jgi:hypothetical protein
MSPSYPDVIGPRWMFMHSVGPILIAASARERS